MKIKYFLIAALLLVGLNATHYFYTHSESALAQNHQKFLTTLSSLRHLETALEKDTLLAHNFLSEDNSSILITTRKLEENCESLQTFTSGNYENLSAAVTDYCSYIGHKAQDAQHFQSLASAIQISVEHVRNAAAISGDHSEKKATAKTQLNHHIMNVGLAYHLKPTAAAKKSLDRLILKAENLHLAPDDELSLLVSHTKEIIKNKDELNTLLNSILLTGDEVSKLEDLTTYYFTLYDKSEIQAARFRNFLFASCLLLLGLVIFAVYSLWRSAQKLADANQHLERRVAERTAELSREKESMKIILNNINQGVFTFSVDGLVNTQHSASCDELFSREIASLPVADVFSEHSEDFSQFIKICFSQDHQPDLLALFPPHLNVNGKSLHMDYKMIHDNGQNRAILCVATDKTQIEALERKRFDEARKNAATIKVLANKNDFIETIQMLEKLKDISDVPDFRRNLHTLKGSFSFLECRWLAELCHEWEQKLSDRPQDFVSLAPQVYILLKLEIEKFIKENSRLLKLNSDQQFIQICLSSFTDTLKYISSFDLHPKIFDALNDLMVVPLGEELEWLNDTFQRTADELGKQVSPIFFDRNDKIPAKIYRELFRSFSHIVRNTADHGIESDSERSQLNKLAPGQLRIKLFEKDDLYEIHFTDNGRGLSPSNLKKICRERHISIPASEADLFNCIFNSDFSSADHITEISGRGIGLNAVKTEALRHGGDCRAFNNPAGGLTIAVSFKKMKFSQVYLNDPAENAA